MKHAFRDLYQARREPAFALYLVALATLGVEWLSPLTALQRHAIWSDALVAVAAAAWLLSQLFRGRTPHIRAFHVGLGLFLATVALSACFADRETAALILLLFAELAVIALLTSQFASDPRRLNAIVLVVCFVSLYSAGLAVVAMGLFYADPGLETSLRGSGGAIQSDLYTRVSAGFQSPPLLGGFCIFASAVVSREDTTLPRRLRLATQIALAVVVVLTLSRAVFGFAAAIAIRAGYRWRDSRTARVAAASLVVGTVGAVLALTLGRLHIDPPHPSSVSYGPDKVRLEHLDDGIDTFAAHPLVGEGPGALVGEVEGADYRAHMTPLNIAATLGLPALVALTFLFVTLWRNRRRPTPVATWSGLAGLAIDGLTHDVEHFRHLWVMIGFADADRRHPAGPGKR